MTSLPDGYGIRPGRLEDIAPVAALEAAYDTALLGHPYMDEAWVREDWTRPRFDPVVDSWIVSSPNGDVAGYGQVYEEQPRVMVESGARVHPDHWGRGIGGAVLEIMEVRAREHLAKASEGSIRFLNDVAAEDASAHALLEAAGYVRDRRFWHMYLDLTEPRPEGAPPPGIVIRRFDRATDAAEAHAVMEEAFEGHYEYAPTPFEEWEETFEKPSFDPALWLVALDGDRIVGALEGRSLMGEGWVSDLGVRPESRGRGIGSALLIESFRAFKERGFTTVALNVDAENETGATALYGRAGMNVRLRWDVFAKVLRKGDSP